ncbi:hypothetical protein HYFRA_00011151 [Hymenoscyphus fraxineus]|uniref:Uncharacterized protein n=1 Tax=Hymenoscyphus fraxineus TaxID=746836 RepID=A0A9N9L387_9HELO|nr:hypothetical protein HYFRA_00011151 [Hymenoscyphus fraxineus]
MQDTQRETTMGQKVNPGVDEWGSPTQELGGLKAEFRFLTLPLEIRMMVYRLLLVSHKPIPDSSQLGCMEYAGIYPAILRTCRQVMNEAGTMLYAENVFTLGLKTEDYPAIGVFDAWNHAFGGQASATLGAKLQDIKKIRIDFEKVAYDDFDSYSYGYIIGDAVEVLIRMPLDYLFIGLHRNCWTAGTAEALQPLTALRGITELVLEDFPEGYEQYLRWKINGDYPSNPLVITYDTLVAGAGHLDICRDDIRDAYQAMKDNDELKVELCRDKILRKIDNQIAKLVKAKKDICKDDIERS